MNLNKFTEKAQQAIVGVDQQVLWLEIIMR